MLTTSAMNAHAQGVGGIGSVDTSLITGFASTIILVIRLVAGTVCIGAIIFGAMRLATGNMIQGIMGVVGAGLAAIVVGLAPAWAGSLTGGSLLP